jgi:CDGSH-type Zn-finger protein
LTTSSEEAGAPRPPHAPEVEIKVRDDGPYRVTGPVRLIDAEGGEWEIAEGRVIALCRCGQSANKPFCDASHKGAGFAACDRASAG